MRLRAACSLRNPAPWIQTATYSISHHLGIDGISLFLVILTTFLTPLAILSSWKSITRRVKPFMICLLTLETGMIGVFCALDLVLFYVFWEVMLIPMYFLIGIWGGERRIYAAVKFILYTMVGSLLMLVGHSLSVLRQRRDILRSCADYAAAELPATLQLTGPRGILAFHGFPDRFCDQSADVPVPHVASGCARRSADGRIRHPGGRSAENGHLRAAAFLPAPVPDCRRQRGALLSRFSPSSALFMEPWSPWCSRI